MLQKGVHVSLKFIITTLMIGEGKDKLVPVHAMKACEGSGGRAPLIFNLGIRAHRTV
jgi:hypothetical protein